MSVDVGVHILSLSAMDENSISFRKLLQDLLGCPPQHLLIVVIRSDKIGHLIISSHRGHQPGFQRSPLCQAPAQDRLLTPEKPLSPGNVPRFKD